MLFPVPVRKDFNLDPAVGLTRQENPGIGGNFGSPFVLRFLCFLL